MAERADSRDATEGPGPGLGDLAHTLARAGIAALPAIGGPAEILLSALINPPLSRRRQKWIESIGEGLKRIEEKVDGFNLEQLSQNEVFVTTVLQATQAAIRNHQEEKLEALRSAVLNAALPNAPDEDLQLMFLDFVDRLTTWHLRVLKFFDDPREWAKAHGVQFGAHMMGAPATLLEEAFSELRGRRDFYDQVVRDLFSRGLMNTESVHGTLTESGMFAGRTTPIGEAFLAFVTPPMQAAG